MCSLKGCENLHFDAVSQATPRSKKLHSIFSCNRTGEKIVSTLTKLVLGMMGQLRPEPARGDLAASILLPPPQKHGGLPLMEALLKRCSSREFAPDALPLPLLSDLLWAAYGVNRADGGRTAPSALNAQEIDFYVALPDGAYLYDAQRHALNLVVSQDLRCITGYQDFVDEAPLDLVFVAEHRRMAMVPVVHRESFASGWRHCSKRLFVCRECRPGYCHPGVDRPQRYCRCTGPFP